MEHIKTEHISLTLLSVPPTQSLQLNGPLTGEIWFKMCAQTIRVL